MVSCSTHFRLSGGSLFTRDLPFVPRVQAQKRHLSSDAFCYPLDEVNLTTGLAGGLQIGRRWEANAEEFRKLDREPALYLLPCVTHTPISLCRS